MKERPIIFSGAMVKAILEGRKTQTRRVIKPQPREYMAFHIQGGRAFVRSGTGAPDSPITETSYPYGIPGARLWVRETWGAVSPRGLVACCIEDCEIQYRADLPRGCTDYPGEWPADEARGNPDAPKWRPSIHMPRWASRISLEVAKVRVERVRDISKGDAYAEGIETGKSFCSLWDTINV